MVEVTIKCGHIVKPAEPTWEGVVALTEFDQVAGPAYVPTVYFYEPSDTQRAQTPIIDTLKESLSQALVAYYPLAGRLSRVEGGGRLELHCNAMGVELVEAECGSRLEDFGDFLGAEKFQHLIPFVDRAKPVHELPLYYVQVTHLRCGGVSVGIMISHAVADGTGSLYFITDWARLARGETLGVLPCHDRTLLRAGQPPKQDSSLDHTMANLSTLISRHRISDQPPKETNTVMLPLTKDQVDKLKKDANHNIIGDQRPYSRFEVLAAHIWRCTCKARGHDNGELKALGMGVDARYRLPSFPQKYFGNSVLIAAARSNVGELLSSPLSSTCAKIRQAIIGVTEEFVWEDIEFLKRFDDLSICQQLRALRGTEEPYVNPNPGVISWLSLPIYNLDFGWGPETHMAPGVYHFDGISLILPAREGVGSVIVFVSLQVAHIEKFKKHFYEDIM